MILYLQCFLKGNDAARSLARLVSDGDEGCDSEEVKLNLYFYLYLHFLCFCVFLYLFVFSGRHK